MNQGNERTTSMSKTKGLVQMAIFAALIVVLAFTPFIGYIPLDLQGRRSSISR